MCEINSSLIKIYKLLIISLIRHTLPCSVTFILSSGLYAVRDRMFVVHSLCSNRLYACLITCPYQYCMLGTWLRQALQACSLRAFTRNRPQGRCSTQHSVLYPSLIDCLPFPAQPSQNLGLQYWAFAQLCHFSVTSQPFMLA